MAAEGSLRVGTVQQVESTLGYIEPDTGEEPAAVLPNACVGFDFTIPPVRTRVVYRQSTQQEDGSHETLAADVFPEDHDFLGTIDKDNGTFGFIQVDGKDDRVFVMPIACSAFGGRIPPLQTPVKFKVVMDNKTGRPRADFVRPQFGAEAGPERQSVKREQPDVQRAPGEVYTGQVSRVKGNFGFIQPDDSSDEIFFMPRGFKAFHGMPPRGMRVGFQIVMDEKTGRPRADNIYPEAGQGVPVAPAEILRIGDPPTNVMGSPGGIGGIGGRMGVVSRICSGFGFIDQEDGESMFVLPASCGAFYGGAFGQIPPVGTTVEFDVVTDSKTGKLRAEDVRPATQAGFFAGTVVKSCGQFGFISQDTQDGTEVRMFVLPRACGGQIPPVGTRVTYTVVEDAKTGRPRAEEVMVLAPPSPTAASPAPQPMYGKGGMGKMDTMDMWMSGTISQVQPTYGFIQPDDGQDRMFVLPGSCTSCGEGIPPVGTRVLYRVVADMKTGKPRAEDVNLEAEDWASEKAGSIMECGERYGFILEDTGEKMFLMPAACSAFGSVIPPEGTRVTFRVVPHRKTGRLRAEDVCPEAGAPSNYGSQGRQGKGSGKTKGRPSARASPY